MPMCWRVDSNQFLRCCYSPITGYLAFDRKQLPNYAKTRLFNSKNSLDMTNRAFTRALGLARQSINRMELSEYTMKRSGSGDTNQQLSDGVQSVSAQRVLLGLLLPGLQLLEPRPADQPSELPLLRHLQGEDSKGHLAGRVQWGQTVHRLQPLLQSAQAVAQGAVQMIDYTYPYLFLIDGVVQ